MYKRQIEKSTGKCNDRVFWRRAGEIMHYIADYFTFPHNKTFDGSLRQHNTYEKHLKNELKDFVESGRADIYVEKNLRFDSLNQLIDYIRERHKVYLDRKQMCIRDRNSNEQNRKIYTRRNGKMPIKIQGELPVKEILERENIFVMDETRAVHQDIRPIQILILNLMPLKEETELQLLRSCLLYTSRPFICRLEEEDLAER